MKTLKLTLGVVCLLFLVNSFCFAQSPTMLKDNYKIMPVTPSSSDKFSTPQEAIKKENLPVIVGETKVEVNSDDEVKLLSQEANKVNLEYIGTDEKIQLAYNNNSIVIDYGGTKLTIDSNVKVGKIVVDKNGLNVYDQAGNLIASLSKAGGGTAFIEGMSVDFAKGANVALKGNGDGKVNTIEVATTAGSYKIERVGTYVVCSEPGGCVAHSKLIITSPSGDTFTFNPKDFNVKSIIISADGSAVMKIRHLSMDMDGLIGGSNKNGGVSIKFDSTGKATSVIVYDVKGQEHGITLARDGVVMGDSETLKLNLTVNADLSVSIGSNAENAVQLNFKQDGSIEAVKPDGTIVPIQGDTKNATFHDDGSLTIGFNDGTIITINPGENPPDPGWWDGMTVDQIISTLASLVGEKKLDEATQKLSELAGADLDLAAQVMQGMKAPIAAQIVNQLDVGLAADVLEKMDAKKVAEILTARTFSMLAVYPIPPVISADKAGQILAAMDKGKAADVLEAITPKDAVPIVKAMLKNQGGIETVAGIMKLMAPAKVAAIMAVPYVPLSELSGSGLTVKECADILKAMGGLKNRVALKILINLFRLNTTKAIAVLRGLLGRKIPA